MKLNTSDAARVLTDFIREDRTEARIWHNRIENLASSVVVASFAISALLIAKVTPLTTGELIAATFVMDAGLVAVLWLSFHRINHDLVLLRKAMKWLQDNLHGLEEGPAQDINVFRNVEDIVPDINDTDLRWLVNLAVVIVVTKAIILMAFWSIFSHH